MKAKSIVKTWAVLPFDCEYSVQYCDSKEQAEMFAKSYEKIGGAMISEIEQSQDVIDRKNKRTATRGYRI
jgi:hypothetical protein